MPLNRDHVAMSYNLAKSHRAVITTQIFQSDTSDTKGACRAIASTWIESHLKGQYAEWRKLVDTFVTQKLHPELEQIQREQTDKFFRLTRLADITKEMTRIHKKVLIRESNRKRKLEELMEQARPELVRQQCLIATNGYTDTADLVCSEEVSTFSCVSEAQKAGAGYYFVRLPTHAIAFYSSDTECRFIDANSCEFVFSNPDDLGSFFDEYLEKMFERAYVEMMNCDQEPAHLRGFSGPAPAALGWRTDPNTWACPFENCSKNRFNSGCYHKSLPLVVSYAPMQKMLQRVRKRIRRQNMKKARQESEES